MRKNIFLFIAWLLLVQANACFADVAIKIVIANPSDSEERTVPVHYVLPGGVKKEDIVSAENLSIDYDVRQGSYFVYGDVKLGPKESRALKVVIKDVWRISEGEVNDLITILDDKIAAVKDPAKQESAKLIGGSLRERLQSILKQQSELADDVEKRMQAYLVNIEKLKALKEDVFSIDNLIDTGNSAKEESTGAVTIAIQAENTLGKKAEMPVKYYLPKEVIPEYIIDKAGFDIKYDFNKEQFYLIKDETFDSGETKRFNVQVKNVWRVAGDMLERYRKEAATLKEKLNGTEFEKIATTLLNEVNRISDEIIDSQKKAETIKDYVSTYRANQRKVDNIKEDVDKLRKLNAESAKKQTTNKYKDVLEKMDLLKLKQLSDMLLKKKIKQIGIWKIIGTLIGFAMALTVFFYAIWFLNLKKEEQRKFKRISTADKPKEEKKAE